LPGTALSSSLLPDRSTWVPLPTSGVFPGIAIGNPEFVPAGRYVKAMLEKEGIWKDVEKSLILGVSVRQVLDYVARGEVDAGFVFATDATLAGDRVVGALEFSPPTPITYPISVVKGSAKAGLAESFISFVLSGDGKAILARYGFVVEGLIPLKKPDSRGVASIFQSLRRTPSTPHFLRKFRALHLGLFERDQILRFLQCDQGSINPVA